MDGGHGDAGPGERIRRAAVALAGLAQNGLLYTDNPFDLDRYHRVAELATELLAALSGRPDAELALNLDRADGYVTPKVDVRGAVIDGADRFLLVRERVDGRWTLPGGWADPGDTPAGAVERELLEEAGVRAEAVKLVGLWDRDLAGNTPPMPAAVYKVFFLCRLIAQVGPVQESEILDSGWFGLPDLPPLSLGRVNLAQLERVLAHHHDPSLPAEFH
jgi:8-oxo-dGTP pyrophosphatase MutT (NUDIX family)